MAHEIAVQATPDVSDEDFCASDVAFHRSLVSATDNPALTYHVASAIEAMQPLMNMITFTARSRAEIVAIHEEILRALEVRDGTRVLKPLLRLEEYTKTLAHSVFDERRSARGRATSDAPETAPS